MSKNRSEQKIHTWFSQDNNNADQSAGESEAVAAMREIVSMAENLDIGEVDEADVEELLDDHDNELTVEELRALSEQQTKETERGISPEEEDGREKGPMPTAVLCSDVCLSVTANSGTISWRIYIVVPLNNTQQKRHELLQSLSTCNVHLF
jgi:hypothetical protein